MANWKERANALALKFSDLKEKSKATDVLTAELEKNKDKLPAAAKTALADFGKRKKP